MSEEAVYVLSIFSDEAIRRSDWDDSGIVTSPAPRHNVFAGASLQTCADSTPAVISIRTGRYEEAEVYSGCCTV
jgi:hypothetical protein